MVFFTCDGCAEALKKNQVERHTFRCRSSTYSCIDCNQVFTSTTYKDHIKCISEDQKYGGKDFVQKENKGEVKQSKWIEQVEGAIRNVREPAVKRVLEQILGYGNIPRKESKFINFLLNSIRIRDRNLCVKAWKCLAEEAKRMQEEEQKQKQNDGTAKKAEEDTTKLTTKPTVSNEGNSNNNEKGTVSNGQSEQDVQQSNNEESSAESRKKFKWKKAIKRTLAEQGGEMKLKKLRKAIISQYSEYAPEVEESSIEEIFDAKLGSAGVLVDGKLVRLS